LVFCRRSQDYGTAKVCSWLNLCGDLTLTAQHTDCCARRKLTSRPVWPNPLKETAGMAATQTQGRKCTAAVDRVRSRGRALCVSFIYNSLGYNPLSISVLQPVGQGTLFPLCTHEALIKSRARVPVLCFCLGSK